MIGIKRTHYANFPGSNPHKEKEICVALIFKRQRICLSSKRIFDVLVIIWARTTTSDTGGIYITILTEENSGRTDVTPPHRIESQNIIHDFRPSAIRWEDAKQLTKFTTCILFSFSTLIILKHLKILLFW